jgi:hypothetical protein
MRDALVQFIEWHKTLNRLRDHLTKTKGIMTSDVSGLMLTREDLSGTLAVQSPGLLHGRRKTKVKKVDPPVWEPSYPALNEATPRANAPTDEPYTSGGPPMPRREKSRNREGRRKDIVYGQRHVEPVKVPRRTPPAGMGMVSDSYRVGPYYYADDQGIMVTDLPRL